LSDLEDFGGGYELLRQMQEAGIPKRSSLSTSEQIDMLIEAAESIERTRFEVRDFVAPKPGLNIYRIEDGVPCIVVDVLSADDTEWSSDGTMADREDMIVATVMQANGREVVTTWSVESWRFEYWEAI
jgi:hypothetical protein